MRVNQKLLIVAGLLVAWEVITVARNVDPNLFPRASAVFIRLATLFTSGELIPYVRNTMSTLAAAVAMGISAAAVLTSLAVLTQFGRNLLSVMASMFNPLPAVALLPLAIIWFGLGRGALLFVIAHSIVWSLSLATLSGFLTASRTLVQVGQNLGLKGWRLVRDIYMPAALPHILTGLRISWAYAWRTLIAAELVFGVSGTGGSLGWFIYQKRYFMETTSMFAALLVIIVIGLIVNSIFLTVERHTVVKWGMSV
ncbi:MAG: ABC transporter permease [Firmicutes bacterium]|jgi:NitT/TauT family transport system permease protein|nr:ABC transporter permease [Bacillota bacterium]